MVVSKKITYPKSIINLKRLPTESEIIRATMSCGVFTNIKFVYIPNAPYEAMAQPERGIIAVSNKFFEYTPAERKEILAHEIGHFYETAILRGKPSLFWKLCDSGIFGSGKTNRSGNAFFDGIFGGYNLHESMAESFKYYLVEPAFLRQKQPEAYKYINNFWKSL